MAESPLTLPAPECLRENVVTATTGHAAASGRGPGRDPVKPPRVPARAPRPAVASLLGLLLLHLSHPLTWHWEMPGVWFPPAALGVVLATWLGSRAAALTAAAGILALLQALVVGTPLPWGTGLNGVLLGSADALLAGLEVWTAWWCYVHLARGQRGLIDPRSATLFLVLVPGALSLMFAAGHALLLWPAAAHAVFWPLVRAAWFSRALGIVALAPPCLVLATHVLTRRGWIATEPLRQDSGRDAVLPIPFGGRIEIAGLALATGIFGLFLTVRHSHGDWSASPLAMLPLLLIIWASLRQGVRGGTLVATTMAVPSLTVLSLVHQADVLLPIQANLLAQCSTALLVGVSFNWIRASEARYRHVVEHVPVVLYSARLTSPAGPVLRPDDVEITFASPGALSALGRAPERLLGSYWTWLGCVHPEDQELPRAALMQLAQFKEPVTCEYRVGPGRWLRDTFVPQLDEEGRLIGWEGVAEDITSQRRLADDLRRTTGMLHTLLNNLPAGVFFVEAPGGQPLLVNARARQLLGQREDMAAGVKHLPEVYRLHRPDGTHYPADQLPVSIALSQGSTSVCDDIVVHRLDGRRVPLVSWAAPVDLSGRGTYDAAVWVLEDLSALRQAEIALRESETRLRVVIEELHEGVLTLDEKGVILDANPAAGILLGLNSVQLPGRAVLDVLGTCLSPDGTPLNADEHPVSVCARSRQPLRDVVIGVKAAGASHAAVRWLRSHVVPCVHPSGRAAPRFLLILAAMPAASDSRDQPALAGELAQRQALAGQLAGGVAHDFNNFLTVMLTSADMAAQALPRSHLARADLDHITEAAERASQLARQLATLCKPRPTEKKPCDLNRLVARTLALVRGTMGRGIAVDEELCTSLPAVCADETGLQQALINLCLNARDAMPKGGRLTVATEVVPAAEGQSSAEVRLCVRDSGPGMEVTVRENLFVTPVSSKARGTGLGLWMTHRIITDHGGRIEVQSQEGEGTNIAVVLPAASPRAA